MLYILIGVGAAMVLVERLWPAMDLPRVRNWWARVALVNLIQLGAISASLIPGRVLDGTGAGS